MLKKNIRRISTVLLTSVVISFGSVSFADKVQDLRKEQDGIESKLRSNQEKLKKAQTDTKSVESQINELDAKTNKASEELTKVEDELKSIEKDIEKSLKELKEAEKKLAEKQENFEARIKVMYINGNMGYLELLLTSKDVKDFFSRKDMVQEIAEQDRDLLEEMKKQKDIIEEKKIELEAQRASLSAAKTKIEFHKRDLEIATREKSQLMSRLEKDVESYEKEYDKLNTYAKSIEGEILDLQGKHAEAQRKKAEAQNKTSTSSGSSSVASSSPSSSSVESSGSSSSSSASSSPSSSGDYKGGIMAWPVPSSNRISSPFGNRIHPIFKTKKLHTGIDIPASSGSNVISASSGTVIASGFKGGYGNTVIVDHGGGIATLYAHNSSIVVSVGQAVDKGTVIAKIGSTGNSTGPHLHFEVRKNGQYINPVPWVK